MAQYAQDLDRAAAFYERLLGQPAAGPVRPAGPAVLRSRRRHPAPARGGAPAPPCSTSRWTTSPTRIEELRADGVVHRGRAAHHLQPHRRHPRTGRPRRVDGVHPRQRGQPRRPREPRSEGETADHCRGRSPDRALVVLVGPSGSGKSTWAGAALPRSRRWSSSDALRAVVGSGESDLDASADAFALLHQIVAGRARRGLTVVVDTLGLDAGLRRQAAASRPGTPESVASQCCSTRPSRSVAHATAARDRPVPAPRRSASSSQPSLASAVAVQRRGLGRGAHRRGRRRREPSRPRPTGGSVARTTRPRAQAVDRAVDRGLGPGGRAAGGRGSPWGARRPAGCAGSPSRRTSTGSPGSP